MPSDDSVIPAYCLVIYNNAVWARLNPDNFRELRPGAQRDSAEFRRSRGCRSYSRILMQLPLSHQYKALCFTIALTHNPTFQG